MTNIKDFLNGLKENDTKVLNYDNFLDELKNTKERDFTNTLKTNMLTPKKGLISIDTFLENLFTYKGQGHFLTDSEIKELENDTDYVYDSGWYTYNDRGSFLAHDINMFMFINNDGNYLVFLQVHTGLDARGGFSSYVAIKFNTKMDYKNAFIYDSTEYELASCLVETQEGKTLTVSVVGRPFDDLASMFMSDDGTWEEDSYTEFTDFSSIKDDINNYVNSNRELAKNFHIKEFTDYEGTPIDL